MNLARFIKWIFVFQVFLITACSDSGSQSNTQERELSLPNGFPIMEGHDGTSVLNLYYVSPETGTFQYESFNITAASKSDYEPISGQMFMEEGVQYEFSITVYGDKEIEGNEAFGIKVLDLQGNGISSVIGQILNDDLPQVSVSSPEVTEEDTGTTRLRFRFTLDEPVVDDYTLNLKSISAQQLNSEDSLLFPYVAEPGSDYEAVDQTITFRNGETEVVVDVVVLSEDLIEENETVLLKLYSISELGYEISALPGYAQGVIRTDETPKLNGFELIVDNPNALVSIAEGTVEVPAGNADSFDSSAWKAVTIELSVKRSENIKQDHAFQLAVYSKSDYLDLANKTSDSVKYVNYAAYAEVLDNSSTLDICLELDTSTNSCLPTSTFTLAPNSTQASVTFYVHSDESAEPNEEFLLSIKSDQGVQFANVLGTIVNDDSESLSLAIMEGEDQKQFVDNLKETASDLKLSEPSSGEVTYTLRVTLNSEPDDEQYTVGYELAPYRIQSPANATDYEAPNATGLLTFAAKNDTQEIQLTLKDDDLYDGDKKLELRFPNTDLKSQIITILDVDWPVVQLGDFTNNTGSIALAPVKGVETDYTLLKEEAVQDGSNENNKTRSYGLSLAIQSSTAKSNLVYDVQLKSALPSGTPASSACTAMRSGSDDPNSFASYQAEGQFDDIVLMDGSRAVLNRVTDSDDATLLAIGSITIQQNESNKSLNLLVKDDDAIECAEYFELRFIPQNNEDGGELSTKFVIPNYDVATLSVSGFTVNEPEADVLTTGFTVTPNKVVTGSIAYQLTSDDAYACSGADINGARAGTVSFSSDDAQTVGIGIKADNLVEPQETCGFALVGNDGVVISYDQSQSLAQGIINDIDQLTLTVSDVSTGEIYEPTSGLSGVSVGEITWDKTIAPNLPNVSLTVELLDCLGDVDCTDLSDVGPQNGYEITNGIVNFALTANSQKSQTLPLLVVNDDTVEYLEQLRFSVELTSDADKQYVKAITDATDNGVVEKTINIRNSDTFIVNVAEVDGACAGFNEESGCHEFRFTWEQGSQIVEEQALSLELSGTMEKVATQANDVVTDPKDLSIEIAYGDASDQYVDVTSATQIALIRPKTDEREYVNQATLRVTVHDDDFVETDESFTLSLSVPQQTYIGNVETNGADWPTRLFNSSNGDQFTHTVAKQADQLVVTVVAEDSAPEPSDTGGVASPFSYYTNLNIAADVPAIDLTVNQSSTCPSGDVCALVGNGNDFTLPSADISLHTGNGTYTALIPSTGDPAKGSESLGIVVLDDNIVEADEKIRLGFTFNDDAVGYVANLAIAEYIISNGDLIDVTITELTGPGRNCTGFQSESGCREFKINWENELESGSVSINLAAANNNEAAFTETKDGNDSQITTDPYDYELTSFVSDDLNNISGSSITLEDSDDVDATQSMTVVVRINDDEFVEPQEKLNVYFSKSTDSIRGITGFNAAGSIEYDIPIQDVLTITFNGSTATGDEPIYDGDSLLTSGIERPFSYTIDRPIAKNAENISMSLDLRACGSGLTCATENQDFSVPTTVSVKELGSLNYISAGAYDLGVAILPDEVVEVDEFIKVRVNESSSYIANFGNVDLTYGILNNDKTELFILKLPDSSNAEGDSGTDQIIYTISWDKAVSDDVPALSVGLDFSSGTALLNTDFTVTGLSDGFLQFSHGSGLSANGSQNFTVNIIGEDRIELTETIIPSLSPHIPSLEYMTIDADNKSGRTHSIVNDDFIYLSLTGDRTVEEDSVDIANIYWTGGVTEALPVIKYDINVSGTGISSADYDVAATMPSINVVAGSILANADGSTILSINEDNIVEPDETLQVSLSLSGDEGQLATLNQFVKILQPEYRYTIENDDFVTAGLKYYKSNSLTTLIEEGGEVRLEFCVPADKTYQSGSGDISFTVNPATRNDTESSTYKNATCDDAGLTTNGNISFLNDAAGAVACNAWSVERNLSLDGLSSGACTEATLATAVDNSATDPNAFFDLSVVTSDARYLGSDIINGTFVMINDDFINLLDTGLMECVESGLDKRWGVLCSGYSESPKGAYLKQDAAETDFYPDLIYTFVDSNGQPAVSKPSSGEVCVQDSATGLIWSASVESNTVADDFVIDYEGDDSPQDEWDCGLANEVDGRTWQLPTVQELVSIMDLNPVSAAKPLNGNTVFGFKSTSTNFYTATSRYWSSDLCTITTADDGAWTVDFITGHVACEAKTSEINSKMFVYK